MEASRSRHTTLLVFSLLLLGTLSVARAQDSLSPAAGAAQHGALLRLVAYLEANLNTLGNPQVPSVEKDILISESYNKLFRDAAVQIEDDLDPARSTVLYKDVSAYLLDVDFFFRSASFRYQVLEVSPQESDSGEPSWILRCLRSLEATDRRGHSLSNEQERFIEINRGADGLKIVSVYTTKLNRKEANRWWWAGLSPQWKALLAGDALLAEGIPFRHVLAYNEALLRTPIGDYRLSGYANAADLLADGSLFFYGDTLEAESLDSLPALDLPPDAIDAFLEGMMGVRELALDQQALTDLEPLAALKGLRRLSLSGCGITDISPLRSLSKLEELDISLNAVRDLEPLRYARQLQRLVARQTAVQGSIPSWTELRHLDLAACPLDSFWSPGLQPSLHYLDVSSSRLISLQRFDPLPQLEHLDLSQTQVARLQGLESSPLLRVLLLAGTPVSDINVSGAWPYLERINLDGTRVSRLDPLSGKSELKRVYCDGSLVSDSSARQFRRQNPQVLLVRETAYLQRWWDALNPLWKQALLEQAQATAPLDKETLHRVASLRSLPLSNRQGIGSLHPIRELVDLEGLDISNTDASDFEALSSLRYLRELNVSGTGLDSLSRLGVQPNLQTLRMEQTAVRDLGVLLGWERLDRLFANGVNASDSSWQQLEQARPDLLIVRDHQGMQAWWDALSPAWKEALLRPQGLSGAPSPEELSRIRRITELVLPPNAFDNLQPVSALSRLQVLRFPGNRIYSLAPLSRIRQLEVLDASSNPLQSLAGIESHNRLRELYANNTPITDLDPLARLFMLEKIAVSGTGIRNLQPLILHTRLQVLDCSNTAIRSLAPLEQVREMVELVVFNTRLSTNRVEQFRQMHPQCSIRFY